MSDKFFQNVFDQAPTGIILIDSQGKFIKVNAYFCRLVGYSSEELLQMYYSDVIHRDGVAHHKRKLHQLSSGEIDSMSFERKFVHKSGRLIFTLISASTLPGSTANRCVVVQVQDITERRQVEELFHKAFTSTPIATSILVLNTLRYIDVNDAFEKVTGYTREETIGSSIVELGLLTQEEVHEYLRELLLNGRIRYQSIPFLTKTGEIRNSITSVDIIDIGYERCALITTEDVTEKVIMESEMSRLDRLNIVGEMAASMSHEIRNPMTIVRGFLQLFKSKHDVVPQSYFDLMIEELDRANSIITQYLALSGHKAALFKQTNLNQVIKLLFPLIAANALEMDKSVELQLGDVQDLELDENEIRQMLINLTRNGLEAMEAGGALKISTYSDQGSVVLAVCDEGKGIPQELMAKIGTPFFTTKEGGTGLGLAVCYRIAERHGAKLAFEAWEKGTRVTVSFPCQVENYTNKLR